MNSMTLESAKDTVRHIENNTSVLGMIKEIHSQREEAADELKKEIYEIHTELKNLSLFIRRPKR